MKTIDDLTVDGIAMCYVARVSPHLAGGGGLPAESHDEAEEWIYANAGNDGCDSRQIELGIELGMAMVAKEAR